MREEQRWSPPWSLADVSWTWTCPSLHSRGHTESIPRGPAAIPPVPHSPLPPHSACWVPWQASFSHQLQCFWLVTNHPSLRSPLWSTAVITSLCSGFASRARFYFLDRAMIEVVPGSTQPRPSAMPCLLEPLTALSSSPGCWLSICSSVLCPLSFLPDFLCPLCVPHPTQPTPLPEQASLFWALFPAPYLGAA